MLIKLEDDFNRDFPSLKKLRYTKDYDDIYPDKIGELIYIESIQKYLLDKLKVKNELSLMKKSLNIR